MDKRTEDLQQLKNAEQLLQKKMAASVKLTSTEAEIERLKVESEKGVAYQQWYPTDHAETAKKEIEKELQRVRNEKMLSLKLRTILGSAIPGGIAAMGIIAGGGTGIFLMQIMFFLIPVVTFPTIVVPSIVKRKRLSRAPLEWDEKHYTQLKAAKQIDEQNIQKNYQQKAVLDEALRKRHAARIAELQPQLAELQHAYDRCSSEVNKLDVLGREDMNLHTVEQLIRIIESRRADNLTAALLVYDEQQARIKAQKAQEDVLATQRAMAQQMAEAEEQRREEQYQRDQKEAEHRRRMEELAHMQLSELERQSGEIEKQRRDNYDYQKINELENAAYRRRMEELDKEQVDELERKRKADNDYRKYGRIENN